MRWMQERRGTRYLVSRPRSSLQPMNITDHAAVPDANAVVRELERHNLSRHGVELEAYGVTVVPPEQMQSPGASAPGGGHRGSYRTCANRVRLS